MTWMISCSLVLCAQGSVEVNHFRDHALTLVQVIYTGLDLPELCVIGALIVNSFLTYSCGCCGYYSIAILTDLTGCARKRRQKRKHRIHFDISLKLHQTNEQKKPARTLKTIMIEKKGFWVFLPSFSYYIISDRLVWD